MEIVLLQYFLGNLGALLTAAGGPAAVVVGTTLPNDADGFPDGTIYLQTKVLEA